ncbi:MAG: ASCH domain-containing protein [Lentisphaeria bacterium]|nr:ASCH domain-containing protein [Lentisphaeria bacterium]
MKCLFVRAPFAGWIVDGVKTIEYRTRQTNIRGRIGIIQSKSGTVIGTVEIAGCEWNEELEHYEWKLANAARFAEPFPFPPKNGAVVWIDLDVPGKSPAAPRLSAAEHRKQKKAYEEAIADWLHPERAKSSFIVILKNGSRKEFKSEEEMDDFSFSHAKIVDHCEIVS